MGRTKQTGFQTDNGITQNEREKNTSRDSTAPDFCFCYFALVDMLVYVHRVQLAYLFSLYYSNTPECKQYHKNTVLAHERRSVKWSLLAITP